MTLSTLSSLRLSAAATVIVFSATALLAQPARLKPVLLDVNLPDVAECHGILGQEIADIVRAAHDDPARTFERWRHDHRNMMEAPPVVECESKLWKALNRNAGLLNVARVPAGTESLSLRPSDPAAEQFLRELSASIGSNVDPAGGVPDYQGETAIAINPNNPQQIVASANTYYQDPSPICQSPTGGAAQTYGTMAMYGSIDGGGTWIHRCAPWPATLTGGISGANQYFGSDPSVAWDAQGRAYSVYMLLSASYSDAGTALVCYRSADAGNSWTYLGTIVNNITSTSPFDDKELLAIDNSPGPATTLSHPGRIYVIWDENNVERVAYSDDGAAWTTVVLPTPAFGQYDIGGDIKVGNDGTVYAIWNRLTGDIQTGEATVFSKSVNGGASWSAPATVATEALFSFGSNNAPPAQDAREIDAFGSLSVDTNPASAFYGRLYVAFTDFPSGTTSGTDTNIYVVSSSNGGTTWSTRVKVNDDTGTATQFFPWLAVDPTDGSVNVSWYDTRADANNRRTQNYYARSSNGGTSFEPNILVTDAGASWVNHVNYSDESSSDNSGYNGNQYGDYSGIAAYNRQVHPLWTDSREFYPASGDSRLEDVATATIVNCSAPTTVNAPGVAPGSSCPASVGLTWSAPGSWGTNATGGTYFVYRGTTSTFASATLIASNIVATSYNDSTGVSGTTYYYFISAKNNCPGTALTPMSTNSPASSSIVFPAVITITPASIPAGAIGTAYNTSFSQSGGAANASFSESGLLPTGLTFSGNALSGTPSQTGTFPITITAFDTNGCSGSTNYTLTILLADGSAPANLIATATSTTQVSLTWLGVANTNHYEVWRSSGGVFAPAGTAPGAAFIDTVSAGTTYRYQVRAINNASVASPYSNYDIATTILFNDDPLIAMSTAIQAVHITQLRTAVNAVRATAGLSPYSFTDSSVAGILIKATHVMELRTALDPARSALAVPALSYTNPLTPGTLVRAIDLTEIRNGVK